ncbi:MAG: ATP-dependent helicase DeaD, partial [Mycobacterium sp.]|nr:ATP-dependent helicase DeaD [Mycobacterium sp.]
LFRSLVEDYEREHDVPMADIAAALAVQSRDGEAFLLSPEPPPDRRPKQRQDRAAKSARSAGEGPKKGFATYRIAVGKRHKIGPGAIVGAIANEGGLHRSDFGHITIKPDFSLVELPPKLPPATLKALERTRISGVLINLQPDRGRESTRRRDRGAG